MLALSLLLAQADPAGWGDFVTKVGLGVVSFMALCYGGWNVVKWLLGEVKAGREAMQTSQAAFLVALDKQTEARRADTDKIIAAIDHGNDRVLDALNGAQGGRANGSGRG